MSYRYVYGPVQSRRLGRSLGVDLVPFKTCTYDCIYCQLGQTTNKTLERKEFVPIEGVLMELEQKLDSGEIPKDEEVDNCQQPAKTDLRLYQDNLESR